MCILNKHYSLLVEMLTIFILLHLPIFLVFVSADVPPCTDGVIRFDLNSSYTFYPNDTNGFSGPLFPQYYTCDYQIIVAQGWFARVELLLKTDASVTKSPVVIVDGLNQTEEVNSDKQKFFFTEKGGTIKLATGDGNVNFGFILKWNQYSTTNQQEFKVSKSDDQPTLIAVESFTSSVKLNAETNVAVFAKSIIYTNKNLLRGIIFFDGDSWNCTSLGTGLQLWNSQSQYVSSGNIMTIMNLEPNYDTWYYEAWIQDYGLSKTFVQIQRSINNKYGVNYVMDGSSGASALYSFLDGVLIGLEGSGTLNVYSGTMKETNRFASYSVNDSSLSLPQIFGGDFTIFVVTGGTAKFKFSYDLDSFQTTSLYGRKGFIKSYMSTTLPSTPFITQIDSPDKEVAKFRFNISKFDNKGDPSLTVMSMINNTWSLYKSYNPFSPPSLNDYDELNANSMKFLYAVIDGKADGMFMEFEIDKSSSKRPYIFRGLIMVLLAYFQLLL